MAKARCAQMRGMGIGFVMAHQSLTQLSDLGPAGRHSIGMPSENRVSFARFDSVEHLVTQPRPLDHISVVSHNKYGTYCVPMSSRHRPAAQRILAHEVYEPHTINFIASKCRSGDIIHAGAYFGDFLPALSRACSKGAKVWAFEPNLENYRCARITADMNGVRNIELINAALGEVEGLRKLRTTDSAGHSIGGASHIVQEDSSESPEDQDIEVVTLDNTIGTHRSISIIHLDVEGYEEQALIGAIKIILKWRPILVLEVSRKKSDFQKRLVPEQYHWKWIRGDGSPSRERRVRQHRSIESRRSYLTRYVGDPTRTSKQREVPRT